MYKFSFVRRTTLVDFKIIFIGMRSPGLNYKIGLQPCSGSRYHCFGRGQNQSHDVLHLRSKG